MKAIVCTKYGDPRDLKIEDLPVPSPEEDEVLIKVRATAINDFDWSLVRGKPYPYRLLFGLTKPKHEIPGVELSGVVQEVGSNIGQFKMGDQVYGDISDYGWGTFAEYQCVKASAMTHMTEAMTFEQAAALSHAFNLASQGLIDSGHIGQDEKILINGAGGGVGTLGLQLAKEYRAEVTGVDTGKKLSMMRSLGFDHVIDYKQEDFTSSQEKYDLIIDTKTTRAPSAFARVLNQHGRYITVGGKLPRLLQLVILGRFNSKPMKIVALKPNKDLSLANNLFESGKIKPIIDGPYSLDEIPRLLQYFGEGKHQGKVIVTIPD